ncbi:MAG: hypothetical protein IJ220_07525 [Clostridia bacterium]|nr:hypothetical protein [Clostridia bacterium]
MLDTKKYECDVRYLTSHIVTKWEEYDFSEQIRDFEKRVPRIEFTEIADVEIKEKEVEHVQGFGYEKFIRRYEVIYKDGKYVFVVTVDSHFSCVRKFWLTAYWVTNEEMIKLFTERL